MENNQKNIPMVFSNDPAAIAAAEGARARIQSAYQVALHRPRDVDNARDRILRACKRHLFAARVEFSKPVGGRKIKGPSVRFAELALREWGNVDIETQTIYEDDFVRRIKVRVLDLESNSGFSKEIQINKTVERKKGKDREVLGERQNTKHETVYIVRATDDELQNKENALISKAVRNEGLRLIPSDIVDEAIETSRETLRKRDKEDPDAAKKTLLDSFSELGVRPKDITAYLKHDLDTITPFEIETLRGIYTAIADGETSWQTIVVKEEEDNKKKNDLQKTLDEIPTKEKEETPPDFAKKKEPSTKKEILAVYEEGLKALAHYGIKEGEILKKLGTTKGKITMEDVLKLRGFYAQILEGAAPAHLFPPKEEKSTVSGNEAWEFPEPEKKESEISLYFKKCAEDKIELGEETYYTTLGDIGFAKANEAKTKKDRDKVLKALEEAKEKQDNVEEKMVLCPNTGDPKDPTTQDEMKLSYCNGRCDKRDGCPAFSAGNVLK